MNAKEKHRKPRNVVLCRSSKKDPNIHGKEIQGLVFDHPSMPKIVTVSSVSRKTSSTKPPTGHHAQEEHSTRHYTPAKQHPTGQRPPEKYPTGYCSPEQHTTGYRIPGQYPTWHRAREQHPSRSSPPALIRTPSSQNSTAVTAVQIPRAYHRNLPSVARTAERIAETSGPEISSQAGRSQMRFPSYYRQDSAPPNTISLSATVPCYPQHEMYSQSTHTQQRRNSVGALRHHSGHGVQHSANSVQHLGTLAREERAKKENLGTDTFSRDFHLDIWRESHERAARNWKPPVRGSGQPACLPQTSGHNVETSVPMARFRSLSTSASHSAVFRGENFPHNVEQGICPQQRGSHHSPGQYANDLQSTGDVRRSSTGHPGLLHAEVCTTGVLNPRVRSAEGTTSQVSSPENIRKSSNTPEEYNPVVRSAEGTNAKVISSGNIRTSSSEGYNPVVRSAEGTNSVIFNADNIRKSRRHEAETQAVKMQQCYSPMINTKRQKQEPTTVVVISDSDDEETDSSISNYDSDQDVFMVTEGTEPNKKTAETDRAESIVVCESLSSSSPHESESDETCYITQVKRPDDNSEQSAWPRNERNGESENKKSAWPSMASHESRGYDVNNNEEPSRKELGPNYRSVLYEREIAGHSATQRVVMSEQSFFDKDTRGTKRTSGDKAEYFIAGAAETAGYALDAIARKIRRISYDELESKNSKTIKTSGKETVAMNISSDTSHQPSQNCVHSGENSEPKDHEDIAKLIRSRSENDEQINRQKAKIERTCHQSSQDCAYSGENSRPRDHDDIPKLVRSRLENDDQISSLKGKMERSISPTYNHRPSASHDAISPYFQPGASSATSRDEFRCRNCDRAPTEKLSPGTEGSHTVVKLPKTGPKPTGIVVGVKQAPEAKQPLESNTVGSGKPAKDSGIKCTDDVNCEDQKSAKSGKAGSGLDILHFKIIKKDDADVTWTNEKDDVKPTGMPRNQVPLSQQWQAYTLKLEQERIAKKSCAEIVENKPNDENGVIKRNSWEELKRKFETERKKFTTGVYHPKNATCSDIPFRANATRKRVHSWNVLGAPCKSLKFHDATEILAEQYKRRKSSEESGSEVVARSNTCNSDNNSNTACSEAQGGANQVTIVGDVLNSIKRQTSGPENYKFKTSPTKTDSRIKMEETGIGYREKVLLEIQEANSSVVISSEVTSSEERHSEVKSPELISSQVRLLEVMSSEVRHSEVKSRELISPEVRSSEAMSSEVKHSQSQISATKSSEILPSEVSASEEKSSENDSNDKWKMTQENDSNDIQSTDTGPSEVEPIGVASPGKDPQAEKNPPEQQEELSMQEWIEILQGRIAQVKESIDEETTPWKKKNKRKVLEKLEHNYDWMTGPYVDEAMFFSRRLQFFQTMRKQYELMKKIKTQRKVMKVTDSTPQVKAAKEVSVPGKSKEITKTKEVTVAGKSKEIAKTKEVTAAGKTKATTKTKQVKKTVKCKPKSVKNHGSGFMKKIRKAVLS